MATARASRRMTSVTEKLDLPPSRLSRTTLLAVGAVALFVSGWIKEGRGADAGPTAEAAAPPLVALEPETRPRRPIGMDRGKIVIHDNFDDPLPEFDFDTDDGDDLLDRPDR